MEELTEPEDWKFEPLRDLDRLLRCSICFEYFKTAMMMPNCSHNYCSLCIRRHLQNRQLCPMCSKPVIESQIKCNRLIDALVHSFKSNRNAFMTLLANTTKNGLTTPATVAMATAGVVGGASATSSSSSSSLSGPLHVPQPPSVSGTSILDLTDSELSQGLNSEMPMMDTNETSHAAAMIVVRDEETRCVMKERPSSLLSGGRASSSPAITCTTGTGVGAGDDVVATGRAGGGGGGSTATPPKTVVTAVVHPQTPDGHSRANKTPSRRHSEGLNKKSQKEQPGMSPRGQDRRAAGVNSFSGSGGVSRAEPQGSAASRGNVATPTSGSNLKVPCPVCQVEVFEKFINTHLDKCLNQMTTPTSSSHAPSSSTSSASSPRLKRLPKLVFAVMSDKQLRKQLKEYHLSTQGKREVLLKRIKEFTLLYNAECDSLNPRTMLEVAQEVERAERSKLAGGSVTSRKASTSSSSSSAPSTSSSATALPPPPRSSRKSSDSEITEMREQYMKAHDEHFSKLIADARAREVKRRSSSNTSDTATTPTNPAREHSDSSVSPRAPTMMTESDTVATPHSNNGSSSNRIRPTRTDAITATRGDGRVRPTRDHTDTITTTTSGDSESAGVRVLHSNHLLSYQELNEEEEEDSQVVFATDSPPSPPFLGRGSGGGGAGGGARTACVGGGGGSSSSSRLLSKETTCIPESPTLELKVTPASRKRVSTRNKRSSAISLSTLYQDEEEDKSAMRFPASDEDPDFLPSNTTPFKARKKQKRY